MGKAPQIRYRKTTRLASTNGADGYTCAQRRL